MLSEFMRYMFAFTGVLSLLALVFIDKRYPGGSPIDKLVYIIIGLYIGFVFAGPSAVKKILTKTADKIGDIDFSNLSITLGGKKES